MAFARYIQKGYESDSSTSVAKLLDEIILDQVPPISKEDPNTFRKQRFYTENMEISIKQHWEFLQAAYKLYKAKDRCKYMAIEHWHAFLLATQILGYHTGIEKREAKMIFVSSQMMVVDELKKRTRAVSLTFFDFLEALARVSDIMHIPTEAELYSCFETQQASSQLRYWEYNNRRFGQEGRVSRLSIDGVSNLSYEFEAYFTNQQKANWLEIQPPLEQKFEILMEIIVENLRLVWGGHDVHECTTRMTRMATSLSGGIELDR